MREDRGSWAGSPWRRRADLLSSHSVVHKRQEDTICKKDHSDSLVKESFSPRGWSVTGREAWRGGGISSLGYTQILTSQGTQQPALTGPVSWGGLHTRSPFPPQLFHKFMKSLEMLLVCFFV